IICGVVMLGPKSRNDGGEEFPPSTRQNLAPRLNGARVFWTHGKPLGRPMGTILGCEERGGGIRGALCLLADHAMTPAVCRAALRADLAEGRRIVRWVHFDPTDPDHTSSPAPRRPGPATGDEGRRAGDVLDGLGGLGHDGRSSAGTVRTMVTV